MSPTEKSAGSLSGCQADFRRQLVPLGMMRSKICFPVHKGRGFRIAGWGTFPSQSSSHMRTFISMSFSRKVSRLVTMRHPSSVSCTMPITGLFAWGDTIILGTIISSRASARVSLLCGTCMFISSPSKSALYGEVTERLSLKVEYGRIFTRCPMMDILCRLGCRLNSTASPLLRWRSTL